MVDPVCQKSEIMRAYKDGTIVRTYDLGKDQMKAYMLPNGGRLMVYNFRKLESIGLYKHPNGDMCIGGLDSRKMTLGPALKVVPTDKRMKYLNRVTVDLKAMDPRKKLWTVLMDHSGENKADPCTEHEFRMWLTQVDNEIEMIAHDKAFNGKFAALFRTLHKYSES